MNDRLSALATEAAEQRELLRDSVVAFREREAPVTRVRGLRDSGGGFDRELWRTMAELGWTGILLPEAAGGLGMGVADLAVVVEELARTLAPEPLLEVAGCAALTLAALPAKPQVTALITGLLSGELIPILAWQEHATAIEPEATRVQAERRAGGFVLSGDKVAVPAAPYAEGFLVYVLLEDAPALLWVPRTTPGLVLTPQLLADGSQQATLRFAALALPAEALLAHGEPVRRAVSKAVDETRALAAAYLLGVMSQALTITLDYLRTRVQFGRPIGGFQALQHRAVNHYIQRELTSAVVAEVLLELAGDIDPARRALLASRAKYRATEAALTITRDAVQLHGAIGFTDECDIGLYLKRALVLAAQYGNATAQLRRIARLAPVETEALNVSAAEIPTPADGDWNTLSDAEFRAAVRAWFEREFPSALRYSPRRLHWDEIKEWYFKTARRGWAAPSWPREYGGMGLSPGKLLIFFEEQERWGVARTPDMGITMVGPLLIKHGTPTQRAHYLPKILAGEQIWCQGYSEPNAGSDLASLRTEAVPDGDDFIVNGSKTWTTLAQDATHIFLLVRTDRAAKPQAGISFLLADIKSPGITIRPIRNLAGHEEFCEVFLDNVRIPKANLVGELNRGWTIAKALLSFERIFLGSPKQSQYALQRLTTVATEWQLFADSAFTERFTRLRLDVLDLETIYTRFAAIVKQGGTLGPEVSLLKIWGSETYARLSELLLEAAASQGATVGKLPFGTAEIDIMSLFYATRPATIYGGSNEIQRNIIAKNVLELPNA